MKHNFSIKPSLALLTTFCLICLTRAALGQNPTLFPHKPTPSPGTNQTASNTKTDKDAGLSSADKAFAKEAAKGGMMEVAMGHVAEQNASNSEVKKFGARMVSDHSKANSELKSIAAKKGIELPAAKSPDKWKSDKDYMDMMVKDHEQDLAEFEKQAKNGSDADLKRFADKTASVVRHHLEMAKEIQGKLK